MTAGASGDAEWCCCQSNKRGDGALLHLAVLEAVWAVLALGDLAGLSILCYLAIFQQLAVFESVECLRICAHCPRRVNGRSSKWPGLKSSVALLFWQGIYLDEGVDDLVVGRLQVIARRPGRCHRHHEIA
eukprot:CAMPEP_0172799736 /NCGR_PEP_ID=MMETSP1075-20121228/2057_1 /TAXON_ID=2916 /ORGANISM="Ceratium fusus, Strain PA161109" /LENGTH=129 /DNA_ID=CAMNT_0013637471 /DNA_START=1319 /DNA_END=1706 /DNA_ORIENTATION=+